jgi:hypothetical protein
MSQNRFCNCRVRLPKPPNQPTNQRNVPPGAYHKIETMLMKRTLLFLLACMSFATAHQVSAKPTPDPTLASNKSEKKSGDQKTISEKIALSANGWSYLKGEWVHPDGYKYVKGQVLRTTAKAGKAAPEPPGKLAQENAKKLTPKATPGAQTEADKVAEARRKNLTPAPAPQTGSHL